MIIYYVKFGYDSIITNFNKQQIIDYLKQILYLQIIHFWNVSNEDEKETVGN